jgi:hypothetical protein
MKRGFIYCSILSVAILVSGCATIMGHSTQLVPINSTPSDATILVTDEKGMDVFKGLTPTSVTLQKSDGSYWGKKSYSIRISKDGFETQTVQVTANANGWYIGGNIIFGGLIGWFIVDPLSGNMYNLTPEAINSSMLNKTAQNNKVKDGSISVMLIQDVPTELLSKMQRIN